MTPEAARAWIAVLRDLLLLGLAVYILIFAVQHSNRLSWQTLWTLLTAGMACASLPVGFRWRLILKPDDTDEKS